MRFAGNIGYGIPTEVKPGVWQDVITEKSYFGDVVRNSRHLQSGEKVNDDLSVSNSVSVVADAFGLDHIFAIRYVTWQGVRWKVSNVEVARPRLVLTLGGVYDGPAA